MDYSRSEMDSLINWRKEKVCELKSCGLTIDEIVESLKPKQVIRISHATVHQDLKTKEKEVETHFKDYIEKELPVQHSVAVTGLDRAIKESWRIYARAAENRTRLAAMSIISDATMKKQAVLGDPAQSEKTIKLVTSLQKKIPEKESNDSSNLRNNQGYQ